MGILLRREKPERGFVEAAESNGYGWSGGGIGSLTLLYKGILEGGINFGFSTLSVDSEDPGYSCLILFLLLLVCFNLKQELSILVFY